jgi:hypothetical protein
MRDENVVVNQPADAAPSQAVEVPKNSEDYAKWRLTGALPEKPQKAPADGDAKPSDSDAAGKADEKGAPASEAGKETKGKEQQPRSTAATRLNEILADLKTAGLSPAELKTFKREHQKPLPVIAAPEKPVEPVERPKRPKYEDFEGDNEAYEAAMDKHEESLAEWKAEQAIERFKKNESDKATRNELTSKLAEAKTRYGEEAQSVITTTVGQIVGDAKISMEIKRIINESPVLVDLMFVMGQKAEDLADFINTAQVDPGAAIRKVILLERLVMEELTKKKPAKADGDEEELEVVATTLKKLTKAPPPPEELGGHKGGLPDEVAEAGKDGDFARFRRTANSRDLARAKGL